MKYLAGVEVPRKCFGEAKEGTEVQDHDPLPLVA